MPLKSNDATASFVYVILYDIQLYNLGSYCCVARNCMGETSSLAELTIEDIQNQLNESEKLQLTSNTQPPRFLLGLKSIEANINESFVFRVKGW